LGRDGVHQESQPFASTSKAAKKLILVEFFFLLSSSVVAKEFLAQVVEQARGKGLTSDERFTVGGTLLEAWAAGLMTIALVGKVRHRQSFRVPVPSCF